MEQFSLEKYLENPSRRVVTRDGREVDIVKYDIKGTRFPVLYVISNEDGTQGPCVCSKNGMCLFDSIQSSTDLFFADEKPQSAEFSFGAFDSEFVKDEYLIPEGCEARIEWNKVIIEKKEDELTEFEKEFNRIVTAFSATHAYMDKNEIHHYSKGLLDLARKEIQPKIDEKLKEEYNRGYSIGKFDAGEAKVKELVAEFEKGRQNALKSLPKWKKATKCKEFDKHVCVMDYYTFPFLDTEVNEGDYYIKLEDLKNLPKEE